MGPFFNIDNRRWQRDNFLLNRVTALSRNGLTPVDPQPKRKAEGCESRDHL
jgi:hypothetical protein